MLANAALGSIGLTASVDEEAGDAGVASGWDTAGGGAEGAGAGGGVVSEGAGAAGAGAGSVFFGT
ncbi:hypothetical protein QQ056_03010 [Oscillatoria laete-virens NRMC-F 0139]|nr:hypothetical protein [Oscillatoria laete-virens]MDL5052532.1 hypothetical protein [Oscillatoria laete-virens NRMC-F 0139]